MSELDKTFGVYVVAVGAGSSGRKSSRTGSRTYGGRDGSCLSGTMENVRDHLIEYGSLEVFKLRERKAKEPKP